MPVPNNDDIKKVCELYARIYEEIGGTVDEDNGLIGFKDETNHVAATATIFIALTDPRKVLAINDPIPVVGAVAPGSFDPATKSWSACPTCGAPPQTGYGAKGPWFKCNACGIWLNTNGKTSPIKPKPF